MIGQPLRRLEDARLVVGDGRYVGDISLEGMSHVVFVRSATGTPLNHYPVSPEWVLGAIRGQMQG